METSTLYWILGIFAFLFITFTHFMFGFVAWFASKHWGAVAYRDLVSNDLMWVDYDSMKDAPNAGYKLIDKRWGPFGFFSKRITIPEPFVMRDTDGKVEKLYGPKNQYQEMVLGRIMVELGALSKAETLQQEYKARYMTETVKNEGIIDTRVEKDVKRASEMTPMNMIKKGGSQNRGGSYGNQR